VLEVFDFSHELAKVAQRPLSSLCDLGAFMPDLAEKGIREVERFLYPPEGKAADAGRMPDSVKQVVHLRSNLRSEDLLTDFDRHFWAKLQKWYDMIRDLEHGGSGKTETTVEWAIAYCEQLKSPLPDWMMNKDQVEALRKLQAALESRDEKHLREAVIFAKQADYKSDPKLCSLYESTMKELKALKRLPSGWEVTDLVGDDAEAKMFKKIDIGSSDLKALFQKLFDETKASIITRDRVGSVPRAYQVEKIISVMNADSWGSYMKRVDDITTQCSHFSGVAPLSDETWDSWSGKVSGYKTQQDILSSARLPGLQASANEFLMFHGTKPEAADSIASKHFDMAFACKTGLFGAGLYFAESSSKSDEYVKPDAEGRFPMIICRVTLGRINYCPHKDPITDPGREKLESSCLSGDYHSVLGDRKKAKNTYREFIVYDHYQVYPHFIVWYNRLG